MLKYQRKNWKAAVALAGAAGVLLTACGSSTDSTETSASQATVTETTEAASTTETTVTTEASTSATTSVAEAAATEASSEATTEAATTATTEATTEASTETASDSPIVDGQIQYTDDLVNTFYGDDAVMDICVLGDSQFGNFRGYDGLAYLISQYCHANVWNIGIGGATAAVPVTSGTDKDTWDSVCGVGVAYALTDQVSSDFLADDFPYQKYLIDSIDLSTIDVFVIEYGVNDFMDNIELDGDTNERSYRNAETTIARTLHDYCPNAKIILCGPTYAQFFDGDEYLGDINTYANETGYCLIDYCEALQNQVTNTLQRDSDADSSVYTYFNAYENVNINSTNATETLQDDRIHMNSEGRARYAPVLSRVIIRSMGYSIDEGVDPSTVEWWTTKTE